MIASRARRGSLAVRGATLAYLGVLVALPAGGSGVSGRPVGTGGASSRQCADPIALHSLKLTFRHGGGDGR